MVQMCGVKSSSAEFWKQDQLAPALVLGGLRGVVVRCRWSGPISLRVRHQIHAAAPAMANDGSQTQTAATLV